MCNKFASVIFLIMFSSVIAYSQGWDFVGPDSANWQNVHRISGKWSSPNSFRLAAVTHMGIAVFPPDGYWNYSMRNFEGSNWFPGYGYYDYAFSPWEDDTVYIGYANYYTEPAFTIFKASFSTGFRSQPFPAWCWATPLSVVFSVEDSIGYATVCGFYRTMDAGITWDEIESNDAVYYSKVLAVNSRTGREVYKDTILNFSTTVLLKSTDSGVTWDSLFSVPVTFFFQDSPLSVFASGDTILVSVKSAHFDTSQNIGIFRSTDNGVTWFHIYQHNRVYGILSSKTSANLLFAASEDGILESTDFGATWGFHNNRLPTRRLTGFIISSYSDTMFVSTETHGILKVWNYVTEVRDGGDLPSRFELFQNYPNPFSAGGGSAFGGNPSTTMQFSLSSQERDGSPAISLAGMRSAVTLKVYDLLGREVATIVNENLEPGTYQRTFSGEGLPSGVYFYRLQAGEFTETRKLILLK